MTKYPRLSTLKKKRFIWANSFERKLPIPFSFVTRQDIEEGSKRGERKHQSSSILSMGTLPVTLLPPTRSEFLLVQISPLAGLQNISVWLWGIWDVNHKKAQELWFWPNESCWYTRDRRDEGVLLS